MTRIKVDTLNDLNKRDTDSFEDLRKSMDFINSNIINNSEEASFR